MLTRVEPVVLASARKHAVSDDDILHAFANPIRVFRLDDLTMLVGPDRAGRLLEIGVSTGDGIDFIVHAMSARAKFLR